MLDDSSKASSDSDDNDVESDWSGMEDSLAAGKQLAFEAGYFPDYQGSCTATLMEQGVAHTPRRGLQPMWTMSCDHDGATINQPTAALLHEIRCGRIKVVGD